MKEASMRKGTSPKPARVEIGSLVVHQPDRAAAPQRSTLGQMVESHLKQLISRHGAPAESRQAGVVRLKASERNPQANLAAAIARELYRGLQGKV
jgi:hypothetical protein